MMWRPCLPAGYIRVETGVREWEGQGGCMRSYRDIPQKGSIQDAIASTTKYSE